MATKMPLLVEIHAGVSGGQAVDALSDKLRKMAEAGNVSAGQIKQAYRQLPAQFTDIAVSLAGGQNPFMVLLMQGGQIRDQFGSIGNAIKAIGGAITPARLAIGAFAGGVAVLGKALIDADNEFSNFQKTMRLTGNTAGVSYGEFVKLSRGIADATGNTVANTKALMMGALGSGLFGPDSLQSVTTAMAKFQEVSGATSDEVVKDFSGMAKSASQWAAQKSQVLNFITVEQYKYIRSLEIAGRNEEAMRVAADALTNTLNNRTQELGYLEEAWKKVKKAASDAWDRMLNVGRPVTLESQIAQLERELKLNSNRTDREDSTGPSGLREGADKQRQRILDQLALLREQQRMSKQAADAAAQRSQAEKKALADEASGYNARVAMNAMEQANIREQMGADNRLTTIRRAEAELKAERDKALIDEATYIRRSTQLKQQAIDVEMQMVNARMANLRGAPVTSREEAVSRETELAKLQADLVKLSNQRRAIGTAGGIDAGVADFKSDRALQNYIASLKAQNELLALEAQAVTMSDFAHRQLIEAKRHEIELNEKTKDMPAAQAKAYRDAANAAFKERQATEGNNFRTKAAYDLRLHSAELAHNNDLRRTEALQLRMTDFAYKQLVDTKQHEYDLMVATRRMPEEQARQYRDAENAAFALRQQIERLNYEQSRTFQTGARQSLRSYADEITNVAKHTERVMTSAFKGMEDALVQFAMTGKLSFRSLALSIIQDLIRIQIQQSVMKPLLGALGGLFGGGGTGLNSVGATGAYNSLASYDGGGYTGSGARSGGLDGKGGFLAMVHPNETVIDHTKGQSLGSTSVVVNVSVESGTEQVQNDQGASQLGRIIAGAVKQELINQKRPGGLLAA